MKTFDVTLRLIKNASRDLELDVPETKNVEFKGIEAETERDAIRKASDLDQSGLSIWDSYAYEQ